MCRNDEKNLDVVSAGEPRANASLLIGDEVFGKFFYIFQDYLLYDSISRKRELVFLGGITSCDSLEENVFFSGRSCARNLSDT